MSRFKLALATTAALTFAQAEAQDRNGSGEPPVVDRLLACRAIEASAERAACLDAAVDGFAQALERGDIAIVERRAVREVERDGFGLNLPSLSGIQQVFRRGGGGEGEQTAQTEVQAQVRRSPDPAEPQVETFEDGSRAEYRDDGRLDRITGAPVASVRHTRDGVIVTLENGQVWRQTDSTHVMRVRDRHMEAGLTVEIERGLLGSYFMELSHDRRRMRARRIQ